MEGTKVIPEAAPRSYIQESMFSRWNIPLKKPMFIYSESHGFPAVKPQLQMSLRGDDIPTNLQAINCVIT